MTTIVTTTTQAAARERAFRSLATGLGLDVAVAVAAAVLAWLPAADVSSSAAWAVFATSLVKTVLQAVASYVLRLKVKPTEEQPREAVGGADGAYDVSTIDDGAVPSGSVVLELASQAAQEPENDTLLFVDPGTLTELYLDAASGVEVPDGHIVMSISAAPYTD